MMYIILVIKIMHRTQIYFEETMFDAIKQKARALNLSISAYIRDILKKELESQENKTAPLDFNGFAGLWEDHDISQEKLRKKAWK